MNPYPEFVVDEDSGVSVRNHDHDVWNEGYRARKVMLCPVCRGNGTVSAGFYSHPGDMPTWVAASSVNSQTCLRCGGEGYIVLPAVTAEIDHIQNQERLRGLE